MASAAQITLNRILAAERRESSVTGEQNNKLAKEYLRRAALWAVRLGCASEWPFFDIARKLDPDVVVNPDLERQLRDHLAGAGKVGPLMCRLLLWSLRWATVEDHGLTAQYSLPRPFEPIHRLYEHGGEIAQHHGMILTPVYGFRPRDIAYYAEHQPYR